jgi:hypothetical protein
MRSAFTEGRLFLLLMSPHVFAMAIEFNGVRARAKLFGEAKLTR